MKKLILLIAFALLAAPAFAADQWSPAIPVSSASVSDFPAQALSNHNAVDRLLSYYREGQAIAYKDASTITIGAGEVTCTNSSTGAHVWRQNASSTDVTFANLDTGSEAPSTTYYVYANCDADATTNTYKISTNATTPTGITSYRLLGSFYNNADSSVANVTDNGAVLVGAYASKTGGATYIAATSGIVTAMIGFNGCTGYSDACRLSIYVGDSSTFASAQVIQDINCLYGYNNWGMASFPVRKGQYYKAAASTGGANGGSCSIAQEFFIPIGE